LGVYYISTPLYYVNARPHIGSAYTTIAADVLARYHRLKGDDVFFLTGTDEHGQKIEQEARSRNVPPQELADRVVDDFKKTWRALSVTYDHFIRTTHSYHERAVQKLFRVILDKGDIYKATYNGPYCIPCESYHKRADLIDGNCPACGRPVTTLEQENYFFRLSRYRQPLIEHFERYPDFVQPTSRRNEILFRVREGLEDVSISRTNFEWGVPVPDDPEHVIWVWFDALTNYISGLGYGGSDESVLERFWPEARHLLGKDILWFHACIWPAMLLAAGLRPPRRMFVHGWWTVGSRKMSKSVGNVVYPEEAVEKHGLDALRYFLLREIPFGQDGDYTDEALLRRMNNDLADELGNLLNRTIGMVGRYYDGALPRPRADAACEPLAREASRLYVKVDEHLDSFAFSRALDEIWSLVRTMNRAVDHIKPWELKKSGEEDRVAALMHALSDGLRVISWLVEPFMPETGEEIRAQLGVDEDGTLDELCVWGRTKEGQKLTRRRILFEKREVPAQ